MFELTKARIVLPDWTIQSVVVGLRVNGATKAGQLSLQTCPQF